MAVQRTLIGNIKGPKGDKGDTGDTGSRGAAATISIGSVTTTAYGGTANVTNSGTNADVVLDFVLPQGAPGETVTDIQDLTLSSMTQPSVQFPTPSIGDTGKVLWGKVVKWFSDMRSLVNTKLNIANVVNNWTTTESGYALDARQGKALNDKIDQRMGVSGVFGMQLRGSTTTNNIAFRVYKNAENTAWTQETINADNAVLTISKREAGESTDTTVATIYSAGNIVMVKPYSYEYTCAANSPVSITGAEFGVSTPSGYVPIGAVAYFTGSQYIFVYRLTPQNTGAQSVISMHNDSSGSITATATVYIMYIKSTSRAAS